MIDHDESWAYLTAELDNLMEAMARNDLDAVVRRLDHVRAEAGKETADILTQMLIDRGGPVQRPMPAAHMTGPFPTMMSASMERPALRGRRTNNKLIIGLSSAVVFLLVAVVVLMSTVFTRPNTVTAGNGSPERGAPDPATVLPTTSTLAAPTTEFTATLQHAPLTVAGPSASGCGSTGIDLDTATVNAGTTSSTDDLVYDDSRQCDLEIRKKNAQNFGTGPAQQPENAEECSQYAAVVSVVGTVKYNDLQPGQTAFCVITSEGNVAWMRLMEKLDRGGQSNPDLVFELTLWKRDA
jgi:hypothetical protein